MRNKKVLYLSYLQCVKLNWGVSAEHADHNLELTLGGVDFGHRAVETFEGSVGNVDNFAFFEVDLVLRVLDAHALLDFGDFFFGDRCRCGVGTNKASNAWCVAYDVPCFIG